MSAETNRDTLSGGEREPLRGAGAVEAADPTGTPTSELIGQGLLATLPGVVSVGGYFTPNDGFQHVIAARNDGRIHEIYWQ